MKLETKQKFKTLDFIKFDQMFELPNPNLRSYFGRVVAGQPDEYRTTFYKGKSVESILDDWSHTLESIGDRWPTLLEYENDLKSKVGPMSIMKPLAERLDDIASYYDSILLESVPIPDEAIKAVLSEYTKIKGLRMKTQQNTLRDMKLSTNSGAPYFRRRRDVVDQTLPVDIVYHWPEISSQVLNCDSQKYSDWVNCAILGWRGQEGGIEPDDVKQRVVWMFPFGVNLCELRVYQPLITACQKHNLVPAWVSMEAVDECITKLFDTKGDDDLIVCTDFSKFDQHFNSDMQNAARTILDELFTDKYGFERWLNNVFPVKYNIPLAIDWKTVIAGKHGMASGSGGTNADETLVHRALQHEAAISQGKTLNPYSQCLGDDGILTYPGITVEDVVRTYSSHGQEMNADKQYASTTDCTYLRRWHHIKYRVNNVCVGVYSTYRALGRLAEQERYFDPSIWSKEMVALRQLSIIENVKYHPLREEFADYCMKGDRYRLGIDIPGFLDNIARIAKEATDLMPDFLGYTKSIQKNCDTGIGSWWIVNYLKSK